jgi:hypothetical protein
VGAGLARAQRVGIQRYTAGPSLGMYTSRYTALSGIQRYTAGYTGWYTAVYSVYLQVYSGIQGVRYTAVYSGIQEPQTSLELCMPCWCSALLFLGIPLLRILMDAKGFKRISRAFGGFQAISRNVGAIQGIARELKGGLGISKVFKGFQGWSGAFKGFQRICIDCKKFLLISRDFLILV